MPVSTEATLRALFVATIEGAWADLDFEVEDGNVHDYLLDWEIADRQPEYLMARVAGENIIQAIGVQVLGDDPWVAVRNITERTYQIEVVEYREYGVSGVGVNKVIDHGTVIRGAIRALGSNLSNYVDQVISVSQVDLRPLGESKSRGPLIQGTTRYVATKRNPDF